MIGSIGVMFVCYGNICRSPMAECVFRDLVERRGLSGRFRVASSGTSGQHIGDPPDPRAVAELGVHGISVGDKRSARLRVSDLVDYDYIVCMDRKNMTYVDAVSPQGRACKVSLLLDHAGGGEVADPYMTGDFGLAFREISRGCEGLLDDIISDEPEVTG